MKKIIRFFSKWRVQLVLFALTILLGIFGYSGYYHYTETAWPFFRPIFSTIKLFGGIIDYNEAGVNEVLKKSGYEKKTDSAGTTKAEMPDADAAGEKTVEEGAEAAETGEKPAEASGAVEKSIRPLLCVIFLWVARYSALLVTVPAIINFLKELFPKLFAELHYKLWKRKKGKLLLIGNNDENIRLYETAGSNFKPMLFTKNGKNISPLQDKELHYYTLEEEKAAKEISAIMWKVFSGTDKITLIINTNHDEINLRLCRMVVDSIVKAVGADAASITERMKEIKDREARKTDPKLVKLRRQVVEKLERVRIFVFGDKQYEQVYLAMEDKSFGVLHYTNRYHLCSFDFLTHHPITEHLNASQLVGDGCVVPDMAFNMIFVGFGDTNREIFLDSFSTNQFVYHRENAMPGLKSVTYHIFDKKAKIEHDKNLNHTIFRYLDDFEPLFGDGITDKAVSPDDSPALPEKKKLNRDDYLEIPPTLGKPIAYEMSIDSEAFYDKIKDICAQNPNSINYLVVAFSDDFNNIDLSQRLAEKKTEWGLKNLYIFAKVRNKLNGDVVEELLKKGEKETYTLFGNESFSLAQVIQNEIEELAYNRKRATLNTESSANPNSDYLCDDTVRVLYDWYTMDQITRRSNIYNILALHMKLQLLGLDYKDKSKVDGETVLESEDAYYKIYAAGCVPVETKKPESYRGARMSYDKSTRKEDYKKYLPRRNLAVQEHYRWDAFMIRNGFIPATRAQIQAEQFKSYTGARYHANLSSFEALFEFRDIQRALFLEKYGPDKQPEDVIAYDYKLMDEAWFFLHPPGSHSVEYEIVRREKL